MNKAGLFGGGWRDHFDALNEAFDRHVAENMPPHPFGASVDAILTGYPDDVGSALPPNSLEHAVGGAPMLATPMLNSASSDSGSALGMGLGGSGPQSGLQFPEEGQGGSYPYSAAFLEQRGVSKPAVQPSLDQMGPDSAQRQKENIGNFTINSNRVEQALNGAGYMVDGQHVGTVGLLAVAKAGKPAIEGVGKALGPIGLGLDIAENAARAHAEIQAGADPRQATAEAAGRVIARNGIVYGTEAVTEVVATLVSLNPALGAAFGVAAGAGAGVAADKSGLTDWAGRTLAPIL